MAGKKKTRSRPLAADLSPEVEYYLESRGYEIPTIVPRVRTEEPRRVAGAVFDPAEVDRKIDALRHLRHTKGKWAGRPIEPTAVQVAFIIAPIFGWRHRNDDGRLVRIVRRVYIEMPRKGAKALAVDTPILTPDGWSTMGALAPGDEVFGPDGMPCRVTHASEIFEGHECFRVTTTDGRAVVADADHLWTVKDRQHKADRGGERWETLTTRELLDRGVTRGVARTEYRWSLPRQESLVTDAGSLPVDPYLLGVWLGDGATACGRISVGFDDIDAMRELLGDGVSARKHRTCWGVTIPGLQSALRAAGLLGNKHIPEVYLTASPEQRLALLQGLMDTDGTMDPGKGRATFSGMNRGLVEDAALLARSLGFRATVTSGEAKLQDRVAGSDMEASAVASTDDTTMQLRLSRGDGRPEAEGSSQQGSVLNQSPIHAGKCRPALAGVHRPVGIHEPLQERKTLLRRSGQIHLGDVLISKQPGSAERRLEPRDSDAPARPVLTRRHAIAQQFPHRVDIVEADRDTATCGCAIAEPHTQQIRVDRETPGISDQGLLPGQRPPILGSRHATSNTSVEEFSRRKGLPTLPATVSLMLPVLDRPQMIRIGHNRTAIRRGHTEALVSLENLTRMSHPARHSVGAENLIPRRQCAHRRPPIRGQDGSIDREGLRALTGHLDIDAADDPHEAAIIVAMTPPEDRGDDERYLYGRRLDRPASPLALSVTQVTQGIDLAVHLGRIKNRAGHTARLLGANTGDNRRNLIPPRLKVILDLRAQISRQWARTGFLLARHSHPPCQASSHAKQTTIRAPSRIAGRRSTRTGKSPRPDSSSRAHSSHPTASTKTAKAHRTRPGQPENDE
jgi:hypothetical protein